jgi:cyclopropane fatty-acyl-phospholipid synthase-like methyltransferase
MLIIGLIIAIIMLSFAGVLLFGAPYVPTLTPQVAAALELLDLQPGQTMLELGCGDGKVVIAAAKQGIRVIGYELNPILWLIAWSRTRRYRTLVSIRLGDYWVAHWPAYNGIFAFI